MKFSTRTLYGLKAVLVLANRYGEGSLSVSQIAKKEGISIAYLEQILNGLKKKGLVKSVRGPQGGYVLAKKPADVSLHQLFYTLEERATAANGKAPAPSNADEIAIGNFVFWKTLHGGIDRALSEMTLKDLIDQARRIKKTRSSSSDHPFNI